MTCHGRVSTTPPRVGHTLRKTLCSTLTDRKGNANPRGEGAGLCLSGEGGGYPRVTQLASCLCLPPNHLQPPLQPPVTARDRFVGHLQPPL